MGWRTIPRSRLLQAILGIALESIGNRYGRKQAALPDHIRYSAPSIT
jgi:hypothetical protein